MALTVIGIMSGSSLDGLDIAHCMFDQVEGKMEWSILEAQTVPITASWKSKLENGPGLNAFDFMQLDAQLGMLIGETVRQWMNDKKIKADLIASHGHTIFHEPGLHFTTQIGNGAHIAAITGVDTITDFRQADVANGGQGAPFAPVADRDLFSGYDGYLNLGGIANVSIQDHDQNWRAWDISPCNQAFNFLAAKKGLPFDDEGKMASSGKIIPGMVTELKKYFPPIFGKAFSLSNAVVKKTWLDVLEQSSFDVLDLLATNTQAIVELIVEHIAAVRKESARILVTGGGAHNSHLFHALNAYGSSPSFVFEKPNDLIVDHKESLLMAYLGYLSFHGKSFGIHSITGATHDSIGGAYYKAVG